VAEAKKPVRCAIYTRKSTEDGLEQDYNSLDAQYDACTAYALSQRNEGWGLVTKRYDDGGFSGGNMDRPGLNALLADIKAGKVDIILLYKIDRLTRSLSDFARIVDVLDNAGASFVSITQSFNTTTSMGRLTLNMLLSFAQFEREVTGERIRDKIEASKKKGIWMGGPVPLGYDVVERKLIENASEAKLVRHIMQRYLDLGSVKALVHELDQDGYRTKIQIRTSTANKGGCAFRRGTIYHLLSNRIYLGEIVHKGKGYAGEHQPIISMELWDRVQQALAERSQGGTTRSPAKWPSLLIGMVVDGENRPMSPSHANKGQKRYRYYITRDDQLDGSPAWRVSAHDLERLVCNEVLRFLIDRHSVQNAFPDTCNDVQHLKHVLEQSTNAATILHSGMAGAKQRLLKSLVSRIRLQEGAIEISITPSSLLTYSGSELYASIDGPPLILTCETVRVRRGHEIRLIIPPASDAAIPTNRDQKLVALIAEARAAAKLVLNNPKKTTAKLAEEHGRCRTRLAKLAALSCIAPDIITAIVEGRQPPSLDARALLAADLPLDWKGQRVALGFDQA
jgi:site-specific DNA recombinase